MYNGEGFVDRCNCVKVEDDFDSGDLGLGSGLRPGGFAGSPAKLPLFSLPSGHTDPPKSDHNLNHTDCQSGSTQYQTQRRNSSEKEKKGKLSRLFSRSSSRSSRKSSDDQEQLEGEFDSREEAFPSYADIPYGTSIRQQKLLFEQDLGHLFHRKVPVNDTAESDSLTSDPNEKQPSSLKADEIERKLLQANQEVEELQLELENCQRRLDAKYRAIDILKQQAEQAEQKTEEHEKQTSEYSHQLERDAEKVIKISFFVLKFGNGLSYSVDFEDITEPPQYDHSSCENCNTECHAYCTNCGSLYACYADYHIAYNTVLQEINHLQFVLDYHQSTMLNSQRTWAARFDSFCLIIDDANMLTAGGGEVYYVTGDGLAEHFVLPGDTDYRQEGLAEEQYYNRACQENSNLLVTLRNRSEELRQVTARNMALLREREELLALLDVQERQQYEKSRTSVSEDDYNHFTSAELAVLGACVCRGRRPEPCGCALAAANMRKEIVKLREEIDLSKQRTDEAYTTVEAYRIAFEEQILRNKELGGKLAEMCTPSNSKTKGSKAKNVIKWIIKGLNEDDFPRNPESQSESTNHVTLLTSDLDLSHCTDRELLVMLLEMINERRELCAHQKVAAKILAKKNQELESKLAASGDNLDT
ncbi:uncharacterized protein LOC135467391 [Liolophura sinensis]|uniref:uncharacterized protein LOC135467391 n=1 Tax=Liolophura sinensis TaxID=3198878 RepID=UPI00315849EB